MSDLPYDEMERSQNEENSGERDRREKHERDAELDRRPIINGLSDIELRRLIEEAAQRRCEYLFARESAVAEKERILNEWMRLKGILELQYGTAFPDGDITITVKRSSLVSRPDPSPQLGDDAIVKP